MTDYKIAPLTWLRTKFAELNHTHSNYVTTSDSRLSDARTPTSHSHGNLQNNGQIGATAQANKNIVTDSSGKITTEDKPTIPSASSTTPSADTTSGSVGAGTTYAKADHTHPKSSLYAEASHTHSQYLTSHQNITGKEDKSNKVTSIDSFNTDDEYPSAKAVYDEIWTDLYGTIQNDYVPNNSLGTVAFSNNYDDLDNLPQLGELAYANDVDLSGHDLDELSDNTNLLFSGDYTDLDNKPTIPTQTSQLTNNSGFITSSSLSNYLQQSDVKDNLTSTDTNKPLSANQGKQLKTLVDGKANSTHLHSDLSQSIQNLGQTISGLAEVATSGDYDDLINTPENLSDFNDDVGYLTSHQNISGKENISNKVTSISSSSTDTQYPSAKLVYDQLNNKAPTSHASSSTTYGVATSSNYGHTKVINNLTTSSNNDGEALSAYQGKILNDKKLEKTTLNTIDSQYQAYGIYNTWDIYDVFVAQQYVSELNITDTSIDCGGIFQGILKFTNKTSKQMYLELTLTNSNGENKVYCSFSSNSGNDIDITTTKTSITLQPDTVIYLFIEEENVIIDYAVKSNSSEISVIADMIYPVGSIYMSVNNNNPQILFGGRWEQLKDRFLLGSGDTYTNGSTGGSADAVAVSHNHTQNSHSHEPSNTSYKFLTATTNIALNGTKRVFPSSTNGAYHFVYAEDSTGGINEYKTTNSVAPTINSNGVSGTGKNMPPYLTVYMWKRIA